MATIRLTSSDDQEFRVEKDIAEKSVLLKNMLEGNAHVEHAKRAHTVDLQTWASRKSPSPCPT